MSTRGTASAKLEAARLSATAGGKLLTFFQMLDMANSFWPLAAVLLGG